MFRSSNRSLLRKLLENGARRSTSMNIRSEGTRGLGVALRYLSHEPILSSQGSYAKRFPPLFHPLPGLVLPPPLPDSMERCPTRITTLPNGLRIASEDALGPAACVGIFVDSGSVYESDGSTGVSHLLEKLAFKSTKNRNNLQIMRDIEKTGGNVTTSSAREQMGYTYDTLKLYLPEALELLVDCIRNPLFLDDEVAEQVTNVKRDIGEIINDPQRFLMESLVVSGYSGALGKPLMAPEAALEKIDGSVVGKFYYENYTANRMVLAAYGVDHEHLLTIVEPLLHDLNRAPHVEMPKSTYTGGDFRHKAESEATHVALAFEVPGGWHDEKFSTALTVLQTLMGGGGSFSSGGPGKGMRSRLYVRVLNAHQEVQNFSAVSSVNDNTGLFGIFLSTGSDFVKEAVHIAASELLTIASPGAVSEIELLRAKNATKSVVLTNLESRTIVAEDIGRQILTYGCRKSVEHFLKHIDDLTLNDITAISQIMLSSPLTMASFGDVDRVPDYDYVSSLFRAQD